MSLPQPRVDVPRNDVHRVVKLMLLDPDTGTVECIEQPNAAYTVIPRPHTAGMLGGDTPMPGAPVESAPRKKATTKKATKKKTAKKSSARRKASSRKKATRKKSARRKTTKKAAKKTTRRKKKTGG